MIRYFFTAVVFSALVLSLSGPGRADYMADIGYIQLKTELGSAVPTGAGVTVAQVEAIATTGGTDFRPDSADSQFAGKTIQFMASGTVSGHATGVGTLFYGNTGSIAPAISSIYSYDVETWLTTGYLAAGTGNDPVPYQARVTNHSWIGCIQTSGTDTSINKSATIEVLSRLDYAINRDEAIHVVAMGNGSGNEPLLGSSFNAIAVGRSDGNHGQGSYDLTSSSNPGTLYTSGRTRPDLVVPVSYTSSAAPIVAAAAALLVQVGHGDPSLSTDPVVRSTTITGVGTVYNAERSEVIRAALMAGADREVISGYTVNTGNGLSSTYGAGQLNIYNSYHIIAAGEQNSLQDGGTGEIGRYGFDYDPSFGGLDSSNRTASYSFTTSTTGSIAASLVWNVDITSTEGTGDFYHLGLYLYDEADPTHALAYAIGEADNTENIWYSLLEANHTYLLQVCAITGTDFQWDYSLAWDIDANVVPLPPGLLLLAPGLVGVVAMKRRLKK